MFEVGKEYSFTLLSRDEGGIYEHSDDWEVTAIEGTLLHLLGPDMTDNPFMEFSVQPGEPVVVPERERLILNTASAFFHSAKPVDPAARGY